MCSPDKVAALGYAQYSNKKFDLGLINHYVGRTFIEPTQHIKFGCKIKTEFNEQYCKKQAIFK